MAKVLHFSISPSSEYSGLISFRMDWFDLLVVQGTLKVLLQHHSSKFLYHWCHVESPIPLYGSVTFPCVNYSTLHSLFISWQTLDGSCFFSLRSDAALNIHVQVCV